MTWLWWLVLCFPFFLFCFLLLGWGYIVAFTKVFTIYQIYHNWIYPPPSFSFISPHSWNSFNRSHSSIYLHVLCCQFLNWAICFHAIEFLEFSTYSGAQPLVWYIVYKYFLLYSMLFPYSVDYYFFCGVEAFNFI
jgi:hypothetical protein